MNTNWDLWLRQNWVALRRGAHVAVEGGWYLPHPSTAGFTRPPLAEGVGQVADWVVSCADGSRIHVHEFADGRLVAHRDATDPALGPVQAVNHWWSESKSGRQAAGLVTAGLVLAGSVAAVALVVNAIDALFENTRGR